MKEFIGNLVGTGLRIGIVASRFNEIISKNLLAGSVDTLLRHGVKEKDVEIAWVPGAFEIPLAAEVMASSGKHDAVICLGCVIRGATPHFDYVSSQAAAGILRASQDTKVPVLFGVLTTETLEQAFERSGSKAGNKGCDVALGAIEMANLLKQLSLK